MMTRADRIVRLDVGLPAARASFSGTDLGAGVVPETLPGVRAFVAALRGASPSERSVEAAAPSPLRDHHVVQDRWGDCWFLAALSALTRLRPELVESLVEDQGEGRWRVHLWTEAGERASIPVLAEDGDGWAKIIERALGEHYDVVAGAELDLGFFALTGRHGRYVSTPDRPVTTVDAWNAIVRASRAGHAMTTATVPDADQAFPQLRGSHAYDVVGPDLARGGPHVVLRDPHGARLWVPFDAYHEVADALCVLHLAPRPSPSPPTIDVSAPEAGPLAEQALSPSTELDAIVRDRMAARVRRA